MKKKQTAVDYLVKELSAILGHLETKPMQDLLMVDAINKAKQIEEEQIIDAMCQQLQMEVNASETQKYYKSKEVQDLDNPTDVVDEYEPRKSISERYSMENMAKRRGMTVEKFKIEIDKQLKMQQDIIDKQLSKGWTQEQAETHALRCLYIDGFSGPTFKD